MSEYEWLISLDSTTIRLGLERIENLLNLLGNPERKLKMIHVAGTNGKGSVCAILTSIISQKYKTGMYISPHIESFNERISISERNKKRNISDSELECYIKEIREIAEKNKAEFSFFEFTTALAYYYFAKNKVEYAVIETGLGGRLDATNTITPILSVITSIGLDHLDLLGKTKKKIAKEKAGIIKQNIPVVAQNSELFEKICSEKNSELQRPDVVIKRLSQEIEGQDILISGIFKQEFSAKFKLLGDHQLDNLSLALTAIKKLNKKLLLDEAQIQQGIQNAQWSGRFEVIYQHPKIIVDGAHNPDGIKVLVRTLKYFGEDYLIVAGFSKGRDYEKMLKRLSKVSSRIILCQADYKGEEIEKLEPIAKKYFENVKTIKNAKNAVHDAVDIAIKENQDLCICGSLYVLGEVLQGLRKEFA